jgi:hypothetical protein
MLIRRCQHLAQRSAFHCPCHLPFNDCSNLIRLPARFHVATNCLEAWSGEIGFSMSKLLDQYIFGKAPAFRACG